MNSEASETKTSKEAIEDFKCTLNNDCFQKDGNDSKKVFNVGHIKYNHTCSGL